MSKPVFITFKDTTINVADITWAQVGQTYSDPDKPWTLTIHLRGSDWFISFNFEHQTEAQAANAVFQNLILDALTKGEWV